MECRQAQAQLDFKTLGQDAVSGLDAQTAEAHLADCDGCRRFLEFQTRFDTEIAHAMTDLPVPAGLTERLLSTINAPVTLPSASRPNAGKTRQSWRWKTAGVFAILLPLLTWTWIANQPIVLNDASIRQLAELDLNRLPTDSQSVVSPAGWSSVRGIQLGESAFLAPVRGIEVPIQVFLARISPRQPGVSGFLARLDRSQWHAKLDASSFSSAAVQYESYGTWVVWSEGDAVFVCVLRDDAHAMQRLQDLFARSRELT